MYVFKGLLPVIVGLESPGFQQIIDHIKKKKEEEKKKKLNLFFFVFCFLNMFFLNPAYL